MDGPYVWEPCRGVTDGDRHARVCRGSAALVWCAWMWGEAQGCVCAACASPGQETCSRGCLATEERSSCTLSACCQDVKFVIPSCRGVEACTGAHSVPYAGQQHRLMLTCECTTAATASSSGRGPPRQVLFSVSAFPQHQGCFLCLHVHS